MKKTIGALLLLALLAALFAVPASAAEETIKFGGNDVAIEIIDDFSAYEGLDATSQWTQGWTFEEDCLVVYYGASWFSFSEFSWSLTGADLSKIADAKYIGFKVYINNDDCMAISIQPGTGSKSYYMSNNTDYPIYFVSQGGAVTDLAEQEIEELNGRWAVSTPDELDGYIIVDVRRFCDINDRSGSAWEEIKNQFRSLGFYFDMYLASSVDVEVDNLFVITEELPEIQDVPTEAPTAAPTEAPTEAAEPTAEQTEQAEPTATETAQPTEGGFPVWAIALIAAAVIAVAVICIAAAGKKKKAQ